MEKFFGTPLVPKTIKKPHTDNIESLIDHTFLHPTCTHQDITQLCEEALAYNFFSVCVPPRFVSFAKKQLDPSEVKVVTVVGFPLGYNKTSIKKAECLKAMDNGAGEIDMVLPIGALKEKRWAVVRKDIQALVQTCHNIPLKVILETGYLDPEEIMAGCFLSLISGASFVKTSTGFGPRGASLEDIEIMNACVGGQIGIKASGGIKNLSSLKQMLQAGATRIGTSASVSIMKEKA